MTREEALKDLQSRAGKSEALKVAIKSLIAWDELYAEIAQSELDIFYKDAVLKKIIRHMEDL